MFLVFCEMCLSSYYFQLKIKKRKGLKTRGDFFVKCSLLKKLEILKKFKRLKFCVLVKIFYLTPDRTN